MLAQIREARVTSDSLYGIGSVASFEYRRLELSYMLASSILTTRHSIINAIESFSETFCGLRCQISGVNVIDEPKILNPTSLENADLYRDIYTKSKDKFINCLNLEAKALLQYPYIITSNYDFISSVIPSIPEETILKRSVKNGRIVHPILAVEYDFKVICAGEYSYISMRNGGHILMCNTCSGHYIPKNIYPKQLYKYLSLSLGNIEKLPVLIFTSHGWYTNTCFKNLINERYEC